VWLVRGLRGIPRLTLTGGAAGGIVATTRDMTIWERALYGGRLLPPKQQTELESLVSEQTGQPITQTTLADLARLRTRRQPDNDNQVRHGLDL
jgi:hypothetical protein